MTVGQRSDGRWWRWGGHVLWQFLDNTHHISVRRNLQLHMAPNAGQEGLQKCRKLELFFKKKQKSHLEPLIVRSGVDCDFAVLSRHGAGRGGGGRHCANDLHTAVARCDCRLGTHSRHFVRIHVSGLCFGRRHDHIGKLTAQRGA